MIQVNQLNKSFTNSGYSEQILKDISFNMTRGEIISILGKSGCGKSTLLKILCGFEKPDSGTVILNGDVVERPSRQCVMLFQNYGLMPWRSVLKNVELGLEDTGIPPERRREKAIHYLNLVGLDDKLDLFPHQLSGGMQQRVAIARALVMQPEVILMDEPFAALDTFTRYHLQNEVLRLQQKEKTTIVLVTHDIDEAIYLSDRVLIMHANPGRIHRELNIDLSKPRDRSHEDFQRYRKIIFEEFHLNQPKPSIEYNI
ncbi:MAG: ABC transporter ATP-binding protein [Bacillaceae bacterium]|nr:ABC transporter ATP-binding protein [Bacillaceae bacterium]